MKIETIIFIYTILLNLVNPVSTTVELQSVG
jgi:hypothetical protein